PEGSVPQKPVDARFVAREEHRGDGLVRDDERRKLDDRRVVGRGGGGAGRGGLGGQRLPHVALDQAERFGSDRSSRAGCVIAPRGPARKQGSKGKKCGWPAFHGASDETPPRGNVPALGRTGVSSA